MHKHLLLLTLFIPLLSLSDSPMNALFYKQRAEAHLVSGDTLSAMLDLDKAIRIDNTFIEAYRTRAILLTEMRKLQEAIYDYDVIIINSPNDQTAWGKRGLLREWIADFQGAEADYLKDLEYSPNNILSLEGVCRMKIDQTMDYSGSLPYIEKLLQLFPGKADYLFLKGQAFQSLNKLIEAISLYNQVVKLDPTLATVYFFRGMAYLNLGNNKEACNNFQQAKNAGLTFAETLILRNCE